jgi:hypothetical protein
MQRCGTLHGVARPWPANCACVARRLASQAPARRAIAIENSFHNLLAGH